MLTPVMAWTIVITTLAIALMTAEMPFPIAENIPPMFRVCSFGCLEFSFSVIVK